MRLSEAVNGSRGRTTHFDNSTNVGLQINSQGVDQFLDAIDDDKVKKDILYKAVIAGGKVIQGVAKFYFRNRMGESAMHQSKYIKAPFQDGIVLKGDKAYTEARVSIMKDFRMKFFEKGTEDRYIKQKGHSDLQRGRHGENTGKPNYRGKITAKWFFRDARSNTESINDAMFFSIDNSLKKMGIDR